MSRPDARATPQLHVVTGKGGVGKSTFAAALALRAADDGARVLVVELGAPAGVAERLETRPDAHGVPVFVARTGARPRGSLAVAYYDGEQALSEYLRRRVPLGGMLDTVIAHPLYRAFVSAGPGVRELMAIGKMRDELLGLSTGGPRWDALILDAGSSGHALQLLRMPRATENVFSSGLAHREARRVANTLADPNTTAVHVVALPERMPMAEAAETVAQLRALGLPVGCLVVNQCRAPAPEGIELACTHLNEIAASDAATSLLAIARRALAWLRIQDDVIEELERLTGLTTLRLPRVIARHLRRRELERLAGALPLGLATHAAESFIQAPTRAPVQAPTRAPSQAPSRTCVRETAVTAGAAPANRPSLAAVVARHRVLICVGTGGVGKTTVSAALAVAGARAGRRTVVLTIDPAHQLARALGVQGLDRGIERLDSTALGPTAGGGSLDAGMLDQKAAWDAFITRHAPTAAARDALLQNRFYRQLSGTLAGSTEFMAIEELCRLEQAGRYDLIVIDTPPAKHATDFLRAPERIATLLDPEVSGWLARPYQVLGSEPARLLSAAARTVLRQLERAAGVATLSEISAFFVAFGALFGDVAGRVARARALLQSMQTAFVLVAGPGERVLSEGDALTKSLAALRISLRAVVINRVHPWVPDARSQHAPPDQPSREPPDVAPLFARLRAAGTSSAACTWLQDTFQEAVAMDLVERARLRPLARAVPPEASWTEVPELDHDAHSLADLIRVGRALGLLSS